jgi:cell division protease FtsH
MNNFRKSLKGIIIKLIVVLFFVFTLLCVFYHQMSNGQEKIKYTELKEYIEADEVKEINTLSDSSKVVLILKDDTQVYSYVPSVTGFWEYVDEQQLDGKSFEVNVDKESTENLTTTVLSAASLIMSFVFMLFFIRKVTGSGNFKVKSIDSKVRFSDVAGIDEEREQLSEVVNFLKFPEKYKNIGARIPKGILLVGPSGTGKTLLAKAIAGEAGVPFFQVTGSAFDEKYVGVGAERVRKIFEEAKKVSPSIIFIDEIDVVAQNRYTGKSYSEQTLNQLLAEMDGFDSDSSVIIIAATNHKEVLDPAILRPGRFDRHIYVPLPDVKSREEILKVHARNKFFADDVSLSEIAKKTVGFSGANLENVLNEAALYSVKNGLDVITNSAIDEAIARVIVGIKKENSPMTKEEKHLTAVHEAGHAIVSAVVRPDVKNFCISIVPRGEAGGYNFFDESMHIYSQKKDILKNMQVMYGGRAAEEVIFDDVSSGAASDLEKATSLAYQMVVKFGMQDSSIVVKIGNEPKFNNYIDTQAYSEIKSICNEAYENAKKVVCEYRDTIKELAALLEEEEYLSESEVSDFLSKQKISNS